MKIKRIHISNFKSIKDLVIKNPNPFSVFIGPNGAGKSNIFEALEFTVYSHKSSDKIQVVSMFKGINSIFHYNHSSPWINTRIETETSTLFSQGINSAWYLNNQNLFP